MKSSTERPRPTDLWNHIVACYRQACEFEQRGQSDAAVSILEHRVKPDLVEFTRHNPAGASSCLEKLKTMVLTQWDKTTSAMEAANAPNPQTVGHNSTQIPLDNISGMIDSVQHFQARTPF